MMRILLENVHGKPIFQITQKPPYLRAIKSSPSLFFQPFIKEYIMQRQDCVLQKTHIFNISFTIFSTPIAADDN